MHITLDIPADNEAAFRAMCAENGVEIQRFQKKGPAGGNPRFDVLADTKGAAQAVLSFYFG